MDITKEVASRLVTFLANKMIFKGSHDYEMGYRDALKDVGKLFDIEIDFLINNPNHGK